MIHSNKTYTTVNRQDTRRWFVTVIWFFWNSTFIIIWDSRNGTNFYWNAKSSSPFKIFGESMYNFSSLTKFNHQHLINFWKIKCCKKSTIDFVYLHYCSFAVIYSSSIEIYRHIAPLVVVVKAKQPELEDARAISHRAFSRRHCYMCSDSTWSGSSCNFSHRSLPLIWILLLHW